MFVSLQCYESSKTLLEYYCEIWQDLLVFLLPGMWCVQPPNVFLYIISWTV